MAEVAPSAPSSPLGQPPPGWRLVRLRDITTRIGSGATPTGGQSAYLPARQNFALVRSQNIYDRRFDSDGLAFISDDQAASLRGARLHSGDVLLNITGDGVTFGRSARVPESVLPACVNQHVAIIRANPAKADPNYLLSYLTHPEIKPYIESFNAGGSRRAITKAHIESFVVLLPPLAEQRAIARVLGALDDKIELNRRMNRTLEELAAALFRSWFVDFDPVVAKAAGRPPARLRPDLAALFPATFQDSPLGQIPLGWRVGTVDGLIDVTMGQSPPGSSYNEIGEGVPFFQGCTDFGFRFPINRVFCTAPTRFAKKGDILLSVRAPVGDTNIALEDCAVGRGLAALRGRDGERSFPLYALRSLTDEFAAYEGEGTLFGAINGPALRGLRLILPPAPIIEAFERCAVPWDATIEHNERESRTLAALRDTLLPKLLSGEIRVKAAEKLMEATA